MHTTFLFGAFAGSHYGCSFFCKGSIPHGKEPRAGLVYQCRIFGVAMDLFWNSDGSSSISWTLAGSRKARLLCQGHSLSGKGQTLGFLYGLESHVA